MVQKIYLRSRTSTQPASQRAQVAIVIILFMAVLLTVGLSVATRTSQDLFLSQQQAESTRVFNAAESGVEETLSQDFESTYDDTGTDPVTLTQEFADADVDCTVTAHDELEAYLQQGEVAEVSLNAGSDETLDLYWDGDNCSGANPAALVATIYDNNSTARHELLGCNSLDDGFENASSDSFGDYTISASVDITSDDELMRVRPVYNDVNLFIDTTALDAVQYHTVNCEARNVAERGEETRAIEVDRLLRRAPSAMDYSLYTTGSITK